jgi:DNA-binding transcriptional LysR family regulator
LEQGDIDVALAGFFDSIPGGFLRQKLFEDPFVLVTRDKHPISKLKQPPTLDQMLEYSFTLISTRGDLVSNFDRMIQKKGKQRHVALAVPNSLSAVWSVIQTDLLLIASEKFVRRIASGLPISVMPLPLHLEPINMIQVWHQRTHKDPLRQWLRQKIYGICQS